MGRKPGEWKRVQNFGSAGNRIRIPRLGSLKPVPIPTEICRFLLQAKHRENICPLWEFTPGPLARDQLLCTLTNSNNPQKKKIKFQEKNFNINGHRLLPNSTSKYGIGLHIGRLFHRQFRCSDSPHCLLVLTNKLIDLYNILNEYLHLICVEKQIFLMSRYRAVVQAPRCGIVASCLVPDTSRNLSLKRLTPFSFLHQKEQDLPLAVKGLECEAKHPSPSSVKVKTARWVIYITPYVFRARCLIQQTGFLITFSCHHVNDLEYKYSTA
jgi:hypothetical protein